MFQLHINISKYSQNICSKNLNRIRNGNRISKVFVKLKKKTIHIRTIFRILNNKNI